MRVTAMSHPGPARAAALTLALTLTASLTTLAPLGGRTAVAATSRKVAARHIAGATFSPARASRADRLNWRALARCEAGGNPRAANPAGYYGLYQFTVATWRRVGGHGYPNHASRAEQTVRAERLFQRAGSTPWPTCGRQLYV